MPTRSSARLSTVSSNGSTPRKGIRRVSRKKPAVVDTDDEEDEAEPATAAAASARTTAVGNDSILSDTLDEASESEAASEAGNDSVLDYKEPQQTSQVQQQQTDTEEEEDQDDEAGNATLTGIQVPPSLSTPTKPRPPHPAAAATPTATTTTKRPQQTQPRGGPPRTPFTQYHGTPLPPPPKLAAPQPAEPRLIIHKLVLTNFKSYGGRQEIGPFHKSFSAIVGPNGSGKSNTIDALLFVFGYRASKMRQSKLAELIHNSSADGEDIDYCEVAVHFQTIIDLPGKDEYVKVDGSDLVVSRTADRESKSDYYVNNKKSSREKVVDLLKSKGIDLGHKRFLILQGEVESIALLKPKAPSEHEDGLLEYLEDIIGTSKYKTPIEEAAKIVEERNEVMGVMKGRVGIVLRELNSLKDKKTEAEDYLRDMNELTRRQSVLYQFHQYTLRKNISVVQGRLDEANVLLAAEQEANEGNIAEVENMKAQYQEQHDIYVEVKTQTDTLRKQLAIHEKEQVSLDERKKASATKKKKLAKAVVDDSHALSEAQSWIKNHEETIEKEKGVVVKLEKRLVGEEQELDEIRDGLKDKTAVFTTQIETKQKELQPWASKIASAQNLLDVAVSEKSILEDKALNAKASADEAEKALKELVEGGREKKESLVNLKKEKANKEKELAKSEMMLEDLNKEGSKIKAKVSSSRSRADEAKASLSSKQSENKVLDTLTKLKDLGRIDDFHGRLGDLGTIDDKYDIAITTACGALNNLITDTLKGAQACIDHLRKSGAGRATIIALEKLPSDPIKSIQTPENAPRLFDLVKPREEKFRPAFFKALRNTLVATDLAQANRLAYGGSQRWRVVTLAGELIESSGAMSGGGTRVMKGGMSSKLAAANKMEPKVIEKIERESDEAQKDWAQHQVEVKELQGVIVKLQKEIPQLEIAMTKFELDVRNGEKRVAEAEKRVSELREQSEPDDGDEQHIKLLEKDIAKSQKEVDQLRKKSKAIEDEIKQLQEKILEIGGTRLRVQKSKVDGTRELIQMANDKITKAEVGQAKAENDSEKLTKSIANANIKIEALDEEIAVFESDLQACGAELHQISTQVNEAIGALGNLEEDLTTAKSVLDELEESTTAFRQKELALQQQIADYGKSHKDFKKSHDHWVEKSSDLELQEVDDDEEDEEEAPAPAEGAEGEEAIPALSRKSKQSATLELYSDEELQDLKRDDLQGDVANLEDRVNRSKPNMSVLMEYRKRQKEFDDRSAELEKATNERDAGKKQYDELRQTRHHEFMSGFSSISSKLKEMYQLITLGGLAELELVDSLDPFSEGIIFSVMPPKKSWKNISNLSGGEKTLSSLALVFALQVFKPTPLYFMDEIDAALDFRNVSIIANYIRERTKSAQFIVISLRNDMFELSNYLVGIYKTNNATKSIAIYNSPLESQGKEKSKSRSRPANAQKAIAGGEKANRIVEVSS